MLLCDFHREQAWERWLSTNANGMTKVKGVVLEMLRAIADSETTELYEMNLNFMLKSDIWTSENSGKFRNWMNNIWLPCHKVFFFFGSQFAEKPPMSGTFSQVFSPNTL